MAAADALREEQRTLADTLAASTRELERLKAADKARGKQLRALERQVHARVKLTMYRAPMNMPPQLAESEQALAAQQAHAEEQQQQLALAEQASSEAQQNAAALQQLLEQAHAEVDALAGQLSEKALEGGEADEVGVMCCRCCQQGTCQHRNTRLCCRLHRIAQMQPRHSCATCRAPPSLCRQVVE